jgi:hypothetical protein
MNHRPIEPDREKQVPSQLAGLNSTLDQLSEAVNGLEQALSPVLVAPDPPSDTAEEPACPECELATALMSARRRVETILSTVLNVTSRLGV